jgi:argininosuccinate lyase
MHAFNQSLKYDQRMHTADIRGSIAYAKALRRVGLLTEEEEVKMTQGLDAVGREWATGQVHTSFTRHSIRRFI